MKNSARSNAPYGDSTYTGNVPYGESVYPADVPYGEGVYSADVPYGDSVYRDAPMHREDALHLEGAARGLVSAGGAGALASDPSMSYQSMAMNDAMSRLVDSGIKHYSYLLKKDPSYPKGGERLYVGDIYKKLAKLSPAFLADFRVINTTNAFCKHGVGCSAPLCTFAHPPGHAATEPSYCVLSYQKDCPEHKCEGKCALPHLDAVDASKVKAYRCHDMCLCPSLWDLPHRPLCPYRHDPGDVEAVTFLRATGYSLPVNTAGFPSFIQLHVEKLFDYWFTEDPPLKGYHRHLLTDANRKKWDAYRADDTFKYKGKTPLCESYVRGKCDYGGKCRNDHSMIDRAKKAKICTYNLIGKCSRAKTCRFSHADADIEALTEGPAPRASQTFDIAFSFDTTGSMYEYLDIVKSCIKKTVTDLHRRLSEERKGKTLRVAMIAHGDYCDASETYVTKVQDFTTDARAMKAFVDGCGQTNGGDADECYELVLHLANTSLSWDKDSLVKALVLIGDSDPHEPDYPLNTARLNWRTEAQELKNKGALIFAVHCGGSPLSAPFYKKVADITGGHFIQLEEREQMPELFMGLCLKAASEKEYAAYQAELAAAGRRDDRLFRQLNGFVVKSA